MTDKKIIEGFSRILPNIEVVSITRGKHSVMVTMRFEDGDTLDIEIDERILINELTGYD